MSQSKADYINVIGAGLAGSEAAYQIAKRGIPGHSIPAEAGKTKAVSCGFHISAG